MRRGRAAAQAPSTTQCSPRARSQRVAAFNGLKDVQMLFLHIGNQVLVISCRIVARLAYQSPCMLFQVFVQCNELGVVCGVDNRLMKRVILFIAGLIVHDGVVHADQGLPDAFLVTRAMP